ncbi:MAG: hypothetical protein M0R05_00805 [Bacilli bacterium]|nr:hypothetical protein [Bacilli bacterium]MDD4076881.1 hypothetical protein [Bacilli bacterium]MDD4387881.1 hypothetical protein [Bacilli bacterium]
MLKDNGPLLFINTVSTHVKEVPHQKIFDSRTQKVQNIKTKSKLGFLEERKLNNIIEMYQKNRPVLCNIICEEKEIIGIPFKKNDCKLFIKTSEENIEEIYLNNITDIVIIRF